MTEPYAKIDCTIVRVTNRAALIDVSGHECWIGRSCIHGGDERRLDSLDPGDEVILQIFSWLADKEGLL